MTQPLTPPVTIDQAIEFAEEAFRNMQINAITSDEVEDIAGALTTFLARHRHSTRQPEPPTAGREAAALIERAAIYVPIGTGLRREIDEFLLARRAALSADAILALAPRPDAVGERAKALEEAAKIADGLSHWALNRPNARQGIGNRYANENAREIAKRIRSLAALTPPSASGEGASDEVETWASINQWCDDTFGPATVPKIIARAKKEFDELETDGADHAIEAADVVICLCRIPGFAEALQRKMAINRKRKWRLTGDGTGYHIPETDSAAPASDEGERLDVVRELVEALEAEREHLRVFMLEQPFTEENDTYSDGFGKGLCYAIGRIDAALAKHGSKG